VMLKHASACMWESLTRHMHDSMLQQPGHGMSTQRATKHMHAFHGDGNHAHGCAIFRIIPFSSPAHIILKTVHEELLGH
jgi:hypothetical protein